MDGSISGCVFWKHSRRLNFRACALAGNVLDGAADNYIESRADAYYMIQIDFRRTLYR